MPLADICAELRTKSGQGIRTANVSIPIRVGTGHSTITMPTSLFYALADISEAAAKPAPVEVKSGQDEWVNTLQWVHDRLVNIHRENPAVDYMRKFRATIADIADCLVTKPAPVGETKTRAVGKSWVGAPPADRPTPITDEFLLNHTAIRLDSPVAELMRNLERRLAAKRETIATIERQLDAARRAVTNLERERDNAIADAKQFEVDCIRALHERNEARAQRDEAREQRDALENAMRELYRDDHLTVEAYRIIEKAVPGVWETTPPTRPPFPDNQIVTKGPV